MDMKKKTLVKTVIYLIAFLCYLLMMSLSDFKGILFMTVGLGIFGFILYKLNRLFQFASILAVDTIIVVAFVMLVGRTPSQRDPIVPVNGNVFSQERCDVLKRDICTVADNLGYFFTSR